MPISQVVKKRLVVVLGMHRSGTSAITKTLELLGVGLGTDVHPAGFDNPKGFWEDRECLEINEQLLRRLGSAYDRLDVAWDEIRTDPEISELKLRAIQLCSRKLEENHGIWGFKDPRTCRLLYFWNKVFSELNAEVSFVIAIRNPANVVASLAARNSMPAEKAYFLWLQHVLPSLSFTKGARRVVVEYDELLEDPFLQIARISDKLNLPLPSRQSSSVKEFESNFLDSKLRHGRFTEADLAKDSHASQVVTRTYNLLHRLAKDQESLEGADVQGIFDELNERLKDAAPAFDFINFLEDARLELWQEIANRDNQLAERNNQLDAYKIQADQFDTQLRAAIVQINSLNQAVSERDGQIVLYKNQSDKFVEQINAAIANADSLAQALAQRDIQVANLNQEVAQRKEQIVNLNQEAAQREKQVVNLNQEVAGRDHELFALRNSTSWKITKPLRILSSLASGNWKEIHLSDNKVLRKLSRMAKRSYLELTQNLEALPKDFDAETYLKLNSDIAVSGIDPATHYLLHGRHEGRKYLLPALDMRGGLNFQTDRETILVVSHEASRTGAPILSLNIVQSLTRRYNVVALLLGGGPLSNEFQKSGAGVITAANLKHNPVMAELLMGQLCTRFNFKFALVNSIESREVLPALCNCFVPTISLLHEFASYTRPRDAFRYALFWSGEAVFSTKITLESALEEYPDLCDHSAHVLPQGRCLLPAEVSAEEQAIESARIRRLIRPKGIGEDSLVILGAGFVQLRKGVDLFIDCAARVVRTPQGRKCRFVWVGKGYDPDIDVGYSVYLADQIRRAGLQDHVFFIDETTAIETAYEEADLLLISSRLDPLPNVAIDAMVHGVPVICFDRTTGIADFLNDNGLGEYCVAAYLDAGDMADKILVLASSQSIREDVATRCREASVAYFNMDNYVAQLEVLAHEVEGQVQQELADTQMILGSGLFRKDYAIPYHGQNQSPEKLVRAYVRAWASGIGRRKPFPGFHPGVYLEQHGVAVSGADPFADYLRAGKPEGPWCNPVIVAGEAMQNEPPDNLRVALHIHAYYPELLPEIISRLSRNRICPDLFVSVTNEQARNQAISLLKDYKGKVVDILLVPNRGRDIGPFLTAFGTRILTGYDYVGHIHTKKSVDVKDAAIGQVWYQFLLENLLGGESGSMVDRILIRMENDASIGMVFPDDPNVVGWSANRDFAEPFADRMGIEKLPEHFVFPVGTMFWARVSALAPLINLNLEWSDYPEEPLPYDGSSLHALERLFPLVLSSRNLRGATTNVIGLTR